MKPKHTWIDGNGVVECSLCGCKQRPWHKLTRKHIIAASVVALVVIIGAATYIALPTQEKMRCTSPAGLTTAQVEDAKAYCKENGKPIAFTYVKNGSVRSVWCSVQLEKGKRYITEDISMCYKGE